MESGECPWPLPLNRRLEILFLNPYDRMKLKIKPASRDNADPLGNFAKTGYPLDQRR
jgi:hypothetical protein